MALATISPPSEENNTSLRSMTRRRKMRALASNLGCVVSHLSPLKKYPLPAHTTATTEEEDVSNRSTALTSGEFNLTTTNNVRSILINNPSGNNNNKTKEGRWRQQPKKKVRFDLKLTKVRSNKLAINDEVANLLWFKTSELQQIKKEHMQMTKLFFRSRKQKAIDEGKSATAENDCQEAREEQSSKSQPQQETVGGAAPEEGVKQGDEEEYWKDTLQRAYQECRRAKRNGMEASGQVDQESLVRLYQKHEELMGMEKYILFMLRGDISKQVKRVLSSLDHFCDPSSDEAFVQQCRAMTQPSIRFVQEIALAQRTAMHLQIE